VTNAQLYFAVGVPVVLNAAMLILGFTLQTAHINKRLDDLRDLWRAELRRVEEMLDARLKHPEE
jgi:hypothetical protein